MKKEFNKLFSAVSAFAVMISALPITELPAIAEEMTNETPMVTVSQTDITTANYNVRSLDDSTAVTFADKESENVLNNAKSSSATDVVWTKETKLTENVTVNGNLYIQNNVDLNGFTLTVNGNLIQNGGQMYIGRGTLNVNGDYTVTNKTHVDSKTGETVEDSNGILFMYYNEGTVNVHGDFYMKSNADINSSGYSLFYGGTIAIDGNFYQYNNGTATNFCSSGTIVKFVGKGTHEIYFESKESYMNTLEVTDGAKVKFTGVFRGFNLSQDIVIDGDTTYDCGNMYLDGHTLTIDGNLTQSGGIMELQTGILNVNGSCTQNGGEMIIHNGTLNVNSDYTVTNKTHVDSKTGETVVDSKGILFMYYADGTVNVHGDFRMKSNANINPSGYSLFESGTLAIDGNFYQYNNGTANNFRSSGTIVKFVGKGTHEIYFESEESSIGEYLEVPEGVKIKFTGIFKGFRLLQDIVIDGDTTYDCGVMDLNGHTLTVDGNLIQRGGDMNIHNGTLNVNGDYTVTNKTHVDSETGETVEDSNGILWMYYNDDSVNVHGDFYMKSNASINHSGYGLFESGTLAIDGNFYQYNNGTAYNFKSYNIVKFVGKGTHEIYFESKESFMNTLEVTDGAKVKFTGVFHGFNLSQDIVIDGDTTYDCGNMYLNGHTLTIDGNLTQSGGIMELQTGILNVNGSCTQNGGEMIIHNGTLNVNGDYTVTNKTHVDSKTGETVVDSNGILWMYYADGTVNVHGDFHMKSNANMNPSGYGLFESGTLAIDGNLYQYNNGTANNFRTYDTIVKFVGKGTHKITSESPETNILNIVLTDGATLSFNGNFGGFSPVKSCIFSSSAPIIAEVTGNTVQAVGSGTAKITIEDASKKSTVVNLTVNEFVMGDANGDGEFTIADVVLLQKWLLAVPNVRLANWEACDLCKDGRIDVFDLCLLKRKLINS